MALTFTETETLVGELEDAGEHPAMRPFPLPPLFQGHPQGGRRDGQPGNFSSFQPRYSELARGYCLLGAGNAQLAQLFGISVTTLQTWINRHPEFAAAIEEGRTHADLLVATAYFRRAAGCTVKTRRVERETKTLPDGSVTTTVRETETVEDVPPDPTAARNWLMLRQGWVAEKPVLTAEDVLRLARLARAEAARRGITFRQALQEVQQPGGSTQG